MIKIKTILFISLIIATFIISCGDSTQPVEEDPPLRNLVSIPNDMVVNAGDKFAVPVLFENLMELELVTLPLEFSGDHIYLDSVSFLGSRVEGRMFSPAVIDNELQTVNIGIFRDTVAIGPGRGLFVKLHFWAYGNSPEVDIVIDTTTIPPAFRLGYSGSETAGPDITPEFSAGKVHINTQL